TSKRFLTVPADSSAASTPFPGATRVLATLLSSARFTFLSLFSGAPPPNVVYRFHPLARKQPPMKRNLRPMLATLTDKPFDDPDWIFETKWDGFRLMAEIKDGSVILYSRNQIDLSRKYPSVCAALSRLHRFAVIDGELVALDARASRAGEEGVMAKFSRGRYY